MGWSPFGNIKPPKVTPRTLVEKVPPSPYQPGGPGTPVYKGIVERVPYNPHQPGGPGTPVYDVPVDRIERRQYGPGAAIDVTTGAVNVTGAQVSARNRTGRPADLVNVGGTRVRTVAPGETIKLPPGWTLISTGGRVAAAKPVPATKPRWHYAIPPKAGMVVGFYVSEDDYKNASAEQRRWYDEGAAAAQAGLTRAEWQRSQF